MLYCVILKCEVEQKDTACFDTEVLSGEKKKTRRMLRYFVTLKCEVKKKTPHASILCDTEV